MREMGAALSPRRLGPSALLALLALTAAGAIGAGVAGLGHGFFYLVLAGGFLVSSFVWAGQARARPISLNLRSIGAIDRIAVWSLSAALMCITWNAVRVSSGVALCDVFLLVAAVATIVSSLLNRTALIRVPRWIVVPAYALAIDALFVVLINEESLSTLLPAGRLIVALTLTPLVIGQIAGRSGSIRWYVTCWLISVAVSATVGVSDAYLHTTIGPSLTGVSAVGRYAGLTAQPNHLAFSTVMALPVILAFLFTARSRLQRISYGLFAGLGVLAILASGSRGGLLAGVLTIAALPFLLPGKRARTALIILLVGILTLGVSQLVTGGSLVAIQRLENPSASASVAKSDSSREEYLHEAVKQIESSPIVGSGFTQIRAAHSLYLQLLAAGGVIAFLSFLTYAGGAIRTGVLLARRLASSEPRSVALIYGLILSVGIWLILGTVENQIYDRYLVTPIGLILAFSIGTAIRAGKTA